MKIQIQLSKKLGRTKSCRTRNFLKPIDVIDWFCSPNFGLRNVYSNFWTKTLRVSEAKREWPKLKSALNSWMRFLIYRSINGAANYQAITRRPSSLVKRLSLPQLDKLQNRLDSWSDSIRESWTKLEVGTQSWNSKLLNGIAETSFIKRILKK